MSAAPFTQLPYHLLHVVRLVTASRRCPQIDFSENLLASLFPQGTRQAQLIVNDTRNLVGGLRNLTMLTGLRIPLVITRVDYNLMASNGREVVTEGFTHKFYGSVTLTPGLTLMAHDGPLFKKESLGLLLDNLDFSHMQSIQFVA